MKYLLFAGTAVLTMAACSKKSSNSIPQGTSVTYVANGQPVTVEDVSIDTSYDYASGEPAIFINGIQLLPGFPDSVTFELVLEGGAYSATQMKGTYVDGNYTQGSPSANFIFSTLDNSYTAGSDASLKRTTVNLSNNGSAISGTFQSYVYSGANANADSVVITNGKFSATLP